LGLPPEDRPYHPHITLARVRQQISPDQRRHIAEAVRDVDPPAAPLFAVREAVLIHSHLSPGGSRYEVLGRCG
ncbi:MAG: 2'-5' RNA ligase family protein, partial [Dehalococcoidia bacterium]